ncbi:hypothetical protein ACJJIP_14110 [Microbulbifer sp. VTAC004]|uniref:hypothetical protein n=1 Tax=Microbulbifer sp. VTAC004 TaxID=3243386 RepID=UPI004039EFC9
MQKAKPFRKLGAQEALDVHLTSESNGAVQLVTFFRVCNTLNIDKLIKGVEYLHNFHPMLHSRIKRIPYAHWFCDVRFEDISIEIKKHTPPLNYEKEFKRLGGSILDLNKFTYCLTVYLDRQGSVKWVAFVFSHAAVDGRSALILIRDLDRYLRGYQTEKSFPSIMHKPVEEYISLRKRLKGSNLRVNDSVYTPVKWPVEEAAHASRRSGCSIYRVLPKESLERLQSFLKKEKILITSFYSAIAILAARSLPGFSSAAELMLPIDAQCLCKSLISKDVVGECTTSLTLSLSPEDTSLDLLSLASLIQKKVYVHLRSGAFSDLALEPDCNPAEIVKIAKELASEKDCFFSGICVSNMGDVQEFVGPLIFFDFGLIMTVQTHGAHPIMVLTYTINGQGVFVFGYCEPLVSRKSAVNYVKKYMKLLGEVFDG